MSGALEWWEELPTVEVKRGEGKRLDITYTLPPIRRTLDVVSIWLEHKRAKEDMERYQRFFSYGSVIVDADEWEEFVRFLSWYPLDDIDREFYTEGVYIHGDA